MWNVGWVDLALVDMASLTTSLSTWYLAHGKHYSPCWSQLSHLYHALNNAPYYDPRKFPSFPPVLPDQFTDADHLFLLGGKQISVLRSHLVWFLDLDHLQPQLVATAHLILGQWTEPGTTSSCQSGCSTPTPTNLSQPYTRLVKTGWVLSLNQSFSINIYLLSNLIMYIK